MLKLPGPMVDADWLAAYLGEVTVVDSRWSMADGPRLDDFRAGHIPGAVFADLDADLSDPPGVRGRHPLPSAEDFAAARARLGITAMPVVVYDDQGGSQAARLWWMLDAIGHPAAVLDGGLHAWPGPLETGDPTVGRSADGESAQGPDGVGTVEVVPWPADRFIDADAIEAAIASGAVVLDARSAERFGGQPNPIDGRPGHIPGSVSRPWTENVGDDGRFLASETLAEELGALGVRPGSDVVASCGSGVTGCHDLLAARLAGVEGGRLYVGSWSEWSQDPDRPVVGLGGTEG